MDLTHVLPIEIEDASCSGAARRAAEGLARAMGFDDTKVGRAALIATELATNVLKYAGNGKLFLSATEGPGRAMQLLAVDAGPGIGLLSESLADGYSTGGTAGNGLGAICRLSDEFFVHAPAGKGTAIVARLRGEARAMPAAVGVVQAPRRGEEVCGDAFAARQTKTGWELMLLDGLGHGLLANEAAQAGVAAFKDSAEGSPADLLQRVHRALKGTRGAAGAIVRVGPEGVAYCGVGNINGGLLMPTGLTRFANFNGTLGIDVQKFREFEYELARPSMVILHSDGLSSRWAHDAYAGLTGTDPLVAAGVLYRDLSTHRDDSTVVALRLPDEGGRER